MPNLYKLGFWLAVSAIGIVSLLPAEQVPETGIWDKAEHFIAYAGLSLLGVMAYIKTPYIARTLIGLACYGAALEVCQSLVPGRIASIGDIIANTAGVLTGFLLYSIMRKYRSN